MKIAVALERAGRMGRAITAAAQGIPDVQIVGAIAARVGSESQGRDLGELAGVGTLGVAVTPDVASGSARRVTWSSIFLRRLR